MVKDRQVQRLWRLLAKGKSLSSASAGSDMSERTGRKYRDLRKLPSEVTPERDRLLCQRGYRLRRLRRAALLDHLPQDILCRTLLNSTEL